jgi:hypothetical protein
VQQEQLNIPILEHNKFNNPRKTVINIFMDSTDKQIENREQQPENAKPNESTGIYVRGFVKITDPDSGEVILETAN